MFKKILLLLLSVGVLFSLGADLSFAAEGFGQVQEVEGGLKGSEQNFYITLQRWVEFFISFLYFVAVVFGLWGGFNILTSSGDEEKVKKGKNIIIYAVIGIVVIFLASSIVDFVFKSVTGVTTDEIQVQQ